MQKANVLPGEPVFTASIPLVIRRIGIMAALVYAKLPDEMITVCFECFQDNIPAQFRAKIWYKAPVNKCSGYDRCF